MFFFPLFRSLLTGWLGLLVASSADWAQGADLAELSLPQLERRLGEIDGELEQLARYSLRSGVGGIGFRSVSHAKDKSGEWVEVTLDRAYAVDEIVLVPTLWRDSKDGFRADGFPTSFRVLLGNGHEDEGVVIASYDESDALMPRIAPLIIPVDGRSATWVRIEATGLSQRAFDHRYVFQLSELMVFSGDRNVALKRPVSASSVHPRDLVHAWDIRFLVDGHMPYLMDAAHGEPSLAYIGSVTKHRSFSLDLGAVYPISAIHLHAVDQSATVPQAYAGRVGVPNMLLIEGATQPDFSDAVTLIDASLKGFTDIGPVMMWAVAEKGCRYLRISSPSAESNARFGFAEIEVISQGNNVALGRPVQAQEQDPRKLVPKNRTLAALTDGRNLYGHILPVKQWMGQLARRHMLEKERPLVVAALNQRYARQKSNLQLMSWLAALLAAGVGASILISRNVRLRQVNQMRERFAADLHDELGANIHTIGLLGDLAREAETREELIELLDRSRVYTERSGSTIRSWSQRLESRGLCEDLVQEMERSAESLLADLDHQWSVEGEENLHKLKARQRIYIFLFYKECLTNIIRHSGATRVETRLSVGPKSLVLSISDNGLGLDGGVPSSLKRRARLLGGKVRSMSCSENGTNITLELKLSRYRLFPSLIPAKFIPLDS